MRKILPIYLTAHVFWLVMFYPPLHGITNFWLMMTLAAAILTVYSFLKIDLKRLFVFKKQHVVIGLMSAMALYAFFWAGNSLATYALPFARQEIGNVYAIKAGASPWLIALLLMFIIGPAEEIFWRGFLQSALNERFGAKAGWLVASFMYAAVHIYAMNLMLLLAALICGLFWGHLFNRYKSLWPVIISHAIWDVAIFIVFPIKTG